MPLVLYDKDLILDACLPVFARHGYTATSTSMLSEAAGVSKPLLFHHFKSKKQLYFNVLDKCRKRFAQEMTFRYLSKQGFFEALENTGVVKYGFYRKNPDLYKVIREAFYSTPQELRDDIQKKYGPVAENIDKQWQISFANVPLKAGVQRDEAFKLLMVTMDYFDERYLKELADVAAQDEGYFQSFLDERISFLNMIRYGIQDAH